MNPKIKLIVENHDGWIDVDTNLETTSCGHSEESLNITTVTVDEELPCHFSGKTIEATMYVYTCGECGEINDVDIPWRYVRIDGAEQDMRDIYRSEVKEAEPPSIERDELDRLLD